eukprot:4823378-Lingulodinium_polyedra.AAC.1
MFRVCSGLHKRAPRASTALSDRFSGFYERATRAPPGRSDICPGPFRVVQTRSHGIIHRAFRK